MIKKQIEANEKLKEVDEFLFKNMHTDFLPSGLITTIEEAMRRANEYGDLTQLAIFMESFPEEVTDNKEACKLIATALRGELPGRSGKRFKSKVEKRVRDFLILQFLYFCEGFGHTIRFIDDEKIGSKDACDAAADLVDRYKFAMITGASIYKHIWLEHKNKGYMEDKKNIFNLSFARGQIAKKKKQNEKK